MMFPISMYVSIKIEGCYETIKRCYQHTVEFKFAEPISLHPYFEDDE